VAGAAVALVALLSGCGADITHTRVERSLAPTFTHLYLQQQALLGHSGVTATTINPHAACHRLSPTAHNTGAGSDWVCQLTWTDATYRVQKGKFELTVHPGGCYEAGGPTKIVGPVDIRAAGGRTVTNPVYEFDACFDTT
jgi:hypothetical protein